MIDLSAVDVLDLMERLDISNARLTSGGDEVCFSCPGPEHSHGDENPSAYMNAETTAFWCHGCHRRGNAVTFVMEVQQVTRPIAEKFLRQTYGVDFKEPVGSMAAETEARFAPVEPLLPPLRPTESWLGNARLDWYDQVEPFMSYMLDRGFSQATLIEWGIGYDYLSDRLTIPVRDVDGALVGLKGRAWDKREPKYLILGDRRTMRYGFSPYEAANVVFGLDRERGHKTVVLCEGELNAIALWQMGVPRPIATGMSYMSERHAQLITREAEEIVVFYDAGRAGHDGVWGRTRADGRSEPGIVSRLEPHMRVRVVDPPDDDPADLLRLGRVEYVLDLIERAPSSLTSAIASV